MLVDVSASVSKKVFGAERTIVIAHSTYNITITHFDTEVIVVLKSK